METTNIEPVKTTQLPLQRIKRLMKLDPQVDKLSQTSVFLIAKATEMFLQSLTRESYSYTEREAKATLMKKHVENAINDIDALFFLDGVLETFQN